jgi:hypothetical protein
MLCLLKNMLLTRLDFFPVPCSPFQLCSTHIVRSPCTVYKGLNCTVLHSVCMMPTLPCRYLAILYSFCQLTIGFLNQRYLSTYKREYLAISLRMKRCVNIFKMGHWSKEFYPLERTAGVIVTANLSCKSSWCVSIIGKKTCTILCGLVISSN